MHQPNPSQQKKPNQNHELFSTHNPRWPCIDLCSAQPSPKLQRHPANRSGNPAGNSRFRKMRQKLLLIPLLVALTSCATVDKGADQIVVNAERTTAIAVDTFDGFLKFEYNYRDQLTGVPAIHKYAEVIRRDGPRWLETARNVTKAYKQNRSATNRANLKTAIAVLTDAISETQTYMTKVKP